ncbi:MAG: hypothetical protein GXO80_07285 [Chlorobi bacterium]|nr:hypothetical protein [Chlorobiota bacterium]
MPEKKQESVKYAKEKYLQLSHFRTYNTLNCSRTAKYYKKKMPAKDLYIKEIIKEVIGTSRKGREKVIRLVQKKHPEIGSYRIRRVYERYGFTLSRRLKRRIKNHPANPIEIPLSANQEWAMDFMSDALADGRRIRTLNVLTSHAQRHIKIITL